MDKAQIPSSHYYATATAGTLLVAYYLVPYLLDPHDYRRRFSGPLTASLSNWWLSSSANSGHHCESLHALHEKHGKFVRIGPNHISIADPNALDAVYGHSNGLLKSEFYDAFKSDAMGDVFNVRDKARIANIFSPQNVQAFEPRVRGHIERFCAQLDMRCEQALKGVSGFNWDTKDGRAVINCCPQFSYLAFDIISDLALGVPFGLIEAQKDSTPAALSLVSKKNVQNLPVVRLIAKGGAGAMALGSYSPWVQKLLLLCTPWQIPNLMARRDFRNITKAAVNTRVNKVEVGVTEDEARGVDLLDKLFEVKNIDGSPLTRDEIDSEALVTIGAGSDTTSNSLSALCFYVASNPQVQKKLQQELDSIRASADVGEFEQTKSTYGLADYEQIKNLPYLNACVKEALRLYSTIGAGLPRVVPAGKTLTIAGETFNEGSVISIPSYSTNRSNVWGADPDTYRPERWLEDSATSLNKYFVPFSTGSRACVGRNLANMDMLLVAAAFFHRYDVELATPATKLEVNEGFVRDATRCDVAIKRRN
ncbi:cytochrome P450 [Rhizoctonia solani]|nr:cytochrome P450 [Rhizoctonia solani]